MPLFGVGTPPRQLALLPCVSHNRQIAVERVIDYTCVATSRLTGLARRGVPAS